MSHTLSVLGSASRSLARGSVFAFLICLMALSSSVMAVEPVRSQTNDSKAITEAFGSVDRSSGWCDDATTTATNIWASSNVPAELGGDTDGAGTAAGLLERSYIRFLTIRIVDATDVAIPVCARYGPDTDAGTGRLTLTCTGTAGSEQTNGEFMPRGYEGLSYQVERIASTDTPRLFVKSASGTVRYCVKVAYHQRG